MPKKQKIMSRAELVSAWEAKTARANVAEEELAKMRAHRWGDGLFIPPDALRVAVEQAVITARKESESAGLILDLARFHQLLDEFCAGVIRNYKPRA